MDLKPVFDAFYDRLVLRDVAGKVVPGSILIFSLLVGAFGYEATTALLQKMGFPFWVILFGFSWLIAFALQYIGEMLHLLRTHPRDIDAIRAGEKEAWTDRRSFFLWLADFHDLASQEQKVHAERINVIREACGNTAISVALSCLLLLICLWSREMLSWFPSFLFFAVALGVAFSLWRMHVIHVDRYGELVKRTVDFIKGNPDTQEGDTT